MRRAAWRSSRRSVTIGWPSSSTRWAPVRTETQVGGGRLYEDIRVPGRRDRFIPRAGWRVPGGPDALPAAADGDLGTAWPARRLDESEGGALVLDLGASRAVSRVVFWPTAVTDLIVPLEVGGSMDAATWERLGAAPDRVGRPAFVAEGRLPRALRATVGSRRPRPRGGVRYLRVCRWPRARWAWEWWRSCSRTRRSMARRAAARTWTLSSRSCAPAGSRGSWPTRSPSRGSPRPRRAP